jgi:hypothetical protein
MRIYFAKQNTSNYDLVQLTKKAIQDANIPMEEHLQGDFDHSWPQRCDMVIACPTEKPYAGKGVASILDAGLAKKVPVFIATLKDGRITLQEVISVTDYDTNDWRGRYAVCALGEENIPIEDILKIVESPEKGQSENNVGEEKPFLL